MTETKPLAIKLSEEGGTHLVVLGDAFTWDCLRMLLAFGWLYLGGGPSYTAAFDQLREVFRLDEMLDPLPPTQGLDVSRIREGWRLEADHQSWASLLRAVSIAAKKCDPEETGTFLALLEELPLEAEGEA